jgi:hypothetical protein
MWVRISLSHDPESAVYTAGRRCSSRVERLAFFEKSDNRSLLASEASGGSAILPFSTSDSRKVRLLNRGLRLVISVTESTLSDLMAK